MLQLGAHSKALIDQFGARTASIAEITLWQRYRASAINRRCLRSHHDGISLQGSASSPAQGSQCTTARLRRCAAFLRLGAARQRLLRGRTVDEPRPTVVFAAILGAI